MQRLKPVSSCSSLNISGLLAILMVIARLTTAQPANSSHEMASRVIGKIILEGNTITQPQIIYRELVFREGDTISLSDWDMVIEASRKNLLNTALFNFVTITTESNGHTHTIRINVIERWYIWPTPIFELTDRNFNTWWVSRDFSRVNYGFRVKWGNFRGRMEDLDFIIRFGKNQHFGIAYFKPYLDREKRFGAGIELGYQAMHEVGYGSSEDKLKFLYDDDYLHNHRFVAMQLSYRKNIHVSHTFTATLHESRVSGTLGQVNPDYFYIYNGNQRYLTLYYKVKADHRDARYYPLSGWYGDFELYKAGLGMNFEGSTDVLWMKCTSRYYHAISNRWYAGFSLIVKATPTSGTPFYFRKGLGYERDYIRGYEYYVVDGEHYLLTRNAIKFALLPQRTSTIGFIPTPTFGRIHYSAYLNLFADAGYTWMGTIPKMNGDRLPETLLMGAGIGLDLVTYYDKVMRVEYSLNKSGENGIFIHFIAGI